jgi:TPP-dependent pyruvate/acetoin dehydrogenase alpha subunit
MTISFRRTTMPDRETLIEMLRLMYRIRCFENGVKAMYEWRAHFGRRETAADDYDAESRGLIGGAVHLCIGQEAVAVGTCAALGKDDYVVSSHRGHGHAIAKGVDVKRIMAELMGRDTGCCHGYGGSMHLFSRERSLLGGNGIIGAGIPIAMGAAFAAKYRGTRQVAVGFFSDGATNQGTFHESLNMAALWELPVIYVCENNLHAFTTPAEIALAIPDVSARASAYGIPGHVVDGMDVLKVYDAVCEAAARARDGQGPTLLECKTFRFERHCGASAGHEDPKQLEAWLPQDPIRRFERQLIEAQAVSAEEQGAMKAEMEREIQDAVAFGKRSPFPSVEGLRAFQQ